MSDDSLESLRKSLDRIDARIVRALADRQKTIAQIGNLKATTPHDLRDIDREEELLSRVAERARAAGLDGYLVTRLFREILDHSVRCQQKHLAGRQSPDRAGVGALVVGYQGTEGAYSHLAAVKHFAARNVEVQYQGHDSFREMLEALRDGEMDYAVLPIENTTAGSINEAYDLLARTNLALVGEEICKVEHCLMAIERVPIGRIRRVYSHPQALEQCSVFLRSLEQCHVESFTDTAMAARRLKEDQDLSEGAIASAEAARLYGLKIIKRGIANHEENYTRFVIVAREPIRFDKRTACKTSIIFATRHEEGALLRCLNVLADHRLNLTKLESRPRPGVPWEYLFYVDFEGNLAQSHVEAALRSLASKTSYLRMLGSYRSRASARACP